MTKFRKDVLLSAGLLLGLGAGPLLASDHADTAQNVNRQGADLTDLFIFPSTSDPSKVVLVMDVHGLLPAGQAAKFSFDPGVLYQFKIDVTGDVVEDLVIQARFSGVGPNQKVLIAGPYRPYKTGSTTVFANPWPTIGTINQAFTINGSMKVFAGVRSDPFFFDLNRFYAILPDRMTPLTGRQIDFPSIQSADTPQVNGFRGFPAGSGFDTSPPMDYLANLNVGSIVVELPRAMLGGGMIKVWMTTSVAAAPPGFNFMQQDRLARPAINEALATVTANRHLINDLDNPTDDHANLANDIYAFMTFPAGRSEAIKAALVSVLVPDVMIANLAATDAKAAYLGVETGGFTGSKFGGRALTDDIVDIDLSAVFGGVIPALKLAPDDGKELPQFSTDNVGPHTDLLNVFPYLGNPH